MVHVRHGDPVSVWAELEDGSDRWSLPQVDRWVEPRLLGGDVVGEATFWLPADLPLGYHTLRAQHPGGEGTCPLVVTPARLELPATLRDRQSWGFMIQLYSLRSRRSWALGDVADLGDLAAWSAAEHDAEFVLVNPLHAAEPVAPMEPSPYRPTSRRFANPVYLRVEDVPEVAYLSPADRAVVERARGGVAIAHARSRHARPRPRLVGQADSARAAPPPAAARVTATQLRRVPQP